jgi:hypothetical protein
MNPLQRLLLLMLVLIASIASAQTGAKSPNEGEAVLPVAIAAAMPEAPLANTTLLAGSGTAFNPAPGMGATLMVRSAVVKPDAPTRISARQRELFYGLMSVEHGAALLDAWSTREVLRAGGRELDPLVRPFAHSPTLYPALQVTPFAVDYFSARLMRSNHRVLRGLWWVPQVVSAAGSIYCGVSNLGNRP